MVPLLPLRLLRSKNIIHYMMKKKYIVPSERIKEVVFEHICQATNEWGVKDDGDKIEIVPGYGDGYGEEGEGGAVKRQSSWDVEW